MGRELTTREKSMIKRSVVRNCANYDDYYKECLPLDGTCYMMTIGFTDSSLCRYYEQAILPVEDEIREILQSSNQALKECQVCGRKFAAEGNQRYCCGACATIAKKKADALRARKYRKKKHG